MNLQTLKQAEFDFLMRYPGGFDDPELQAIAKKHKIPQMVSFCQTHFAADQFRSVRDTAEHLRTIVSRSSLVSVFEKMKFRDALPVLPERELERLVDGLQGMLHGDQQSGFESMAAALHTVKLAKWSLLTVVPMYFRPQQEVFVKPTTVKGVIRFFELTDLHYKSAASWDFYHRYRQAIIGMQREVSPDLSPSTAAFSGFLMMSMANQDSPLQPPQRKSKA